MLLVSQVPTIFSWPGIFGKGHRIDIPINGVDYFPTFIDFATHGLTTKSDIAAIDGADGKSLMTLLTNTLFETDSTATISQKLTDHPLWSRPLFWYERTAFEWLSKRQSQCTMSWQTNYLYRIYPLP